MKIIYIAGTTKATEYRFIVKHYFGDNENFKILDPLEEEKKLNGELNNYINLVQLDKKLINECDIVLAYILDGKSTFGTTMEIMYSYERNKPIIIVDETKKTIEDYWLKYHAYNNKIYTNLIEAFSFIKVIK